MSNSLIQNMHGMGFFFSQPILHKLVLKGDLTKVTFELLRGVNVNQLDQDGKTALDCLMDKPDFDLKTDISVLIVLIRHGSQLSSASMDKVKALIEKIKLSDAIQAEELEKVLKERPWQKLKWNAINRPN